MFAALVSAASVVLLVNYVSSQRAPVAITTSTSASTSQVVVATSDLAAGDQLSTVNVGLTAYPSTALPANPHLYYTDVSKLLSPPQYVSSKLPRGTLILSSLLVAQADAGPTVTQPPIDIRKAGDVAISIPYGESSGAGGYVQPDDHIDLLVDDSTGTVHYAFQDVRVIKVGGRAEQGTSSGTANLLLIELPREQAAALAYLEDRGYSIRYVIRPHNEQGTGPLPQSAPVGGSNWTTFLDG